MLLHLPDGRFPVHVDEAMRPAIRKLPKDLFQRITWDQGNEMHRHADFTVDTGIQIFFCDPTALGNGARTRTPTAPSPIHAERH
jgi:IS30 family transposase